MTAKNRWEQVTISGNLEHIRPRRNVVAAEMSRIKLLDEISDVSLPYRYNCMFEGVKTESTV
jgi:hypothetical protein